MPHMSLTCMLAVADTVPSHTGFASPFLPIDEHGDQALTAAVFVVEGGLFGRKFVCYRTG